jgi:hypothetical protein
MLISDLAAVLRKAFGPRNWQFALKPDNNLTDYLRNSPEFHVFDTVADEFIAAVLGSCKNPVVQKKVCNASHASFLGSVVNRAHGLIGGGGGGGRRAVQQQVEEQQHWQKQAADDIASRELVERLHQEQVEEDRQNAKRIVQQQQEQHQQRQCNSSTVLSVYNPGLSSRQQSLASPSKSDHTQTTAAARYAAIAQQQKRDQEQKKVTFVQQRERHTAIIAQQQQDRKDTATQELIATLQQQNEDDARSAQQRAEHERGLAQEQASCQLVRELELQEQRMMEDARLAASMEPHTFECPVCMDTHSMEDVFIVDGCEHEICRFAMQKHVDGEVAARNLPIRCPCCPMTGNGVTHLSEHQAKQVLTVEEIGWYDRASLAQGTVTCCRCNEPDCDGVAEMAGGWGGNPTRFRCPIPSCAVERCVECAVAWHDGLTCEQYQAWRAENEAGDDRVADLGAAGAFKICPSCGQGVQKSEGCNRMTCNCGANFCYVCNAVLANADPYSHFNKAGATCRLFTGDVYEDEP